jgi:hypothetical protein
MPGNGMVERFNGRVAGEVLGITVHSHRDLERLLRGFNAAYNARRQRVLDGKTPDQVVAERLKARRKLARAKPEGRAGPDDIAKARLIAEAAKDVSQPDSCGPRLGFWPVRPFPPRTRGAPGGPQRTGSRNSNGDIALQRRAASHAGVRLC